MSMYNKNDSGATGNPVDADTGTLHFECKQKYSDHLKSFSKCKHALLFSGLAVGITVALYFLNLYISLTASTGQSDNWPVFWNLFALLFGLGIIITFHFLGNRWTGYFFIASYSIIHATLLATILLTLFDDGETIRTSFSLNPEWMLSFYGVLYGVFFLLYYFRKTPEKKNTAEEEVEDMLFYSMLPFPLNVLVMKTLGRPLPKGAFEFQIWFLAMMGVSFITLVLIFVIVFLLT